jgi:6-phosphogluconolactonase (cycloisomerase 2 family)
LTGSRAGTGTTDTVAAFTIAPAVGTTTPLTQQGIYNLGGLGPKGLAFEPSAGAYVAVALQGSNAVAVYSVAATGLTEVARVAVNGAAAVKWVAPVKPADAAALQKGCDKVQGNLGTGAARACIV